MDEPQPLTIYQTFHRDFVRNQECAWIQPVGVNGYTGSGVQSDDEGDNIAHLNPYYCELTAQYWAWKHARADTVVQGNLDPALVLAGWPVARTGCDQVLDDNGGHPGHIFNLGHGVQPNTDPGVLEHIVAYVHDRTRGSHA